MCVLTWGRLWEDAGGVMLWLERVGPCRTVGVSGLVVLAGGHSVCTGEGKSLQLKKMSHHYVKCDCELSAFSPSCEEYSNIRAKNHFVTF